MTIKHSDSVENAPLLLDVSIWGLDVPDTLHANDNGVTDDR